RLGLLAEPGPILVIVVLLFDRVHSLQVGDFGLQQVAILVADLRGRALKVHIDPIVLRRAAVRAREAGVGAAGRDRGGRTGAGDRDGGGQGDEGEFRERAHETSMNTAHSATVPQKPCRRCYSLASSTALAPAASAARAKTGARSPWAERSQQTGKCVSSLSRATAARSGQTRSGW